MNATAQPKRDLTIRERTDNLIGPIIPEISAGLPANITPERFQAAFVTAVAVNPAIFKCSPQSIRTALMKCAADGLVPDGRQAALVPFADVCTYMPMVGGIISRAKDLGDIERINAQPVHENDTFIWHQGDDERIEHKPAPLGQKRGEIIGAYAIFVVDGKVVHREVMDRDAIEKTRSVSKMKNGPAWSNWYSEMTRKTVIRRGAKYVPMSDKLRTLIEREDEFVDFDQRPQPATSTLVDRLKAAGSRAPNIIEHVEQETGEVIETGGPADEPDKFDDDFSGDR